MPAIAGQAIDAGAHEEVDPQEDLPCAAELLELGEHELDSTLNPFVRIELDLPVLAPDQARR